MYSPGQSTLRVLPQRVKKSVLLLVENLRPMLRLRTTKYPTRVVFRLDHKYTKRRYYDVIYLRRTLGCRQRYVVEYLIRPTGQEEAETPRDLRFTFGSSDLWRLQIRPDREDQNEE